MSTPLCTLVVEDSELDTLLLLHHLHEAGYKTTFRRVETVAEMSDALEAQSWDLILSDFSMPQFSGEAALELCRHKDLDIPFIMVSGRIGEEVAAQIMKAGAHDYVSKDNLVRLAPVVDRELRAARERRARKRAEARMAHLASVVECCDDAIISETLDGVILSWNRGAERIYGFGADEMIGQSTSTLIPQDRIEEAQTISEKIRSGREVTHLETVRLRKSGNAIDVSLTVSPVKDASGNVVAASLVARDITERKHAETERLRLIEELREALARVKTLSGLLPICASCKKIRNDRGYWEQVETYIKERSDADFTHSICPVCMERLYPEFGVRVNAQVRLLSLPTTGPVPPETLSGSQIAQELL
jgi:PAS domain S-box-containing protein